MGWAGPAFELAFPDDAPPELAKEQAAGLWDRFSRAVRRPPPWSDVPAYLLTVAVPGWVHPDLGGGGPARPEPGTGRGRKKPGG